MALHNCFSLIFLERSPGILIEQYDCSICHLKFVTAKDAREHYVGRNRFNLSGRGDGSAETSLITNQLLHGSRTAPKPPRFYARPLDDQSLDSSSCSLSLSSTPGRTRCGAGAAGSPTLTSLYKDFELVADNLPSDDSTDDDLVPSPSARPSAAVSRLSRVFRRDDCALLQTDDDDGAARRCSRPSMEDRGDPPSLLYQGGFHLRCSQRAVPSDHPPTAAPSTPTAEEVKQRLTPDEIALLRTRLLHHYLTASHAKRRLHTRRKHDFQKRCSAYEHIWPVRTTTARRSESGKRGALAPGLSVATWLQELSPSPAPPLQRQNLAYLVDRLTGCEESDWLHPHSDSHRGGSSEESFRGASQRDVYAASWPLNSRMPPVVDKRLKTHTSNDRHAHLSNSWIRPSPTALQRDLHREAKSWRNERSRLTRVHSVNVLEPTTQRPLWDQCAAHS